MLTVRHSAEFADKRIILLLKTDKNRKKVYLVALFFLLCLLNALELTAASFVALARKVRIRLRPITQ